MKNPTKEELQTKVNELTERNGKLEKALSASMQNTLVYLGIANNGGDYQFSRYYAVPGTDILAAVCFEKGTPYYAGLVNGRAEGDPASFTLEDRAKDVKRKAWEYMADSINFELRNKS